MSKSMTKAELEAALVEAQQQKSQLEQQVRQLQQNKRPDGALVFTGNLTVPHGGRQELEGRALKQSIRLPDNQGVLHLVGKFKQSSSGNQTIRFTGWLDQSVLKLEEAQASSATSSSFAEQVVNK